MFAKEKEAFLKNETKFFRVDRRAVRGDKFNGWYYSFDGGFDPNEKTTFRGRIDGAPIGDNISGPHKTYAQAVNDAYNWYVELNSLAEKTIEAIEMPKGKRNA